MTDCSSGTDWPQEAIQGIDLYDSFYNHHDTYQRIHVYLMGLVPIQGGEGSASLISSCKGIGPRKNRLGMKARIDSNADPYVIVETVGGEETGSTSYFPIGKHTYQTLQNCSLPIWDSKTVLLGKKDTINGIHFVMKDKNSQREDEYLCEITIPSTDFPDMIDGAGGSEGNKWKEFHIPCTSTSDRIDDNTLEWVVSICITDCAQRIVPSDMIHGLYQSTEERIYTEQILNPDGLDQDKSLLQCWTQPTSDKAVLWILGRNDCFMHPHVAQRLFWKYGYDLYVLNYKMNGKCRQKGWVNDAHFVSHNYTGTFDVYDNDIQAALQHISSNSNKEYKTTLGYAHSTGAPILLNYLLNCGDTGFDGFLFNSPFLDWGFVGGDMIELVLENTNWLTMIGAKKLNDKLGVVTTPTEISTTPITYLNQEIVLGDWYAKFWSLYYFDFYDRPLYHVPMTVGFAQGVTKVHEKLRILHTVQNRPVTTKPFLVITARGDDVLKSPETLSRADWIGPNRWEIELHHNSHDIFLSGDIDDTNLAIDLIEVWLQQRKFY